jgi:tRNA-splicing ligase RtcB
MKEPNALAVQKRWLIGALPRDVGQALDRLARIDDVHYIAVMPDVHLSHDVCTGNVVATNRWLYPQAVGNDIGCGMAALRFDGPATLLDDEQSAAKVLGGLYRMVPTMRHSRATVKEELPEALTRAPLSHPGLDKIKARDGRLEFATLGRGNHFIEFQADEEDQLWVMIHSGSRVLGQAINAWHLRNAQRSNTGLAYLDAESESGQAYLADLTWACHYADESRREMLAAVAALIRGNFGVSADEDSAISCNHNHVRRETHFGLELWVHRKGAISAQEGEPGIIPGSMGTSSYHVTGRGNLESLCSSSHGAGRRRSRSQALREIPARALLRQMAGVWFDQRLVHQLRDEAPTAYKDVQAVMRAQRDLTRIVRKLRPVLSYKGV